MIALGIDAGGSHTEGVVLDGDGRELGRARGGPGWAGELDSAVANIRDVAGQLARHGHPDTAVIGASGAGDAGVAGALGRVLADLATTVRVTTDIDVMLAGAFGPGGAGLVLIVGTGSAAGARLPDGTVARAGGAGPERGDIGSAYWLGKRALGGGLVTGLGTSRPAVAALAPVVCRLAESGDPRARRLVDEGADHLAALVRELVPHFEDPTVALAGGLMAENSPMRAAVIERLRGFTVLSTTPDPALGAARLALPR